MIMVYDYIIIGGGLGGLCCGIILAKEKKKVLILEQHNKPGGYLHSFYRKGKQFEVGFHFVPELDNDQILNMYWGYLGILDKIELVPYNKNHFSTLIFPDYRIDLPSGLNNLKEKLYIEFPDEKKTIDIFINKMQEIKSYFIYFNKNHTGDIDKEHESFEITISDYLDSINASKKLRSVLLGHSFLYGVPPKEAPLGTHAIFFNALYSSTYDIKGGGDALAKALEQSFLENGGEILYKKEVCRIITDNKLIKGIETKDNTYYQCVNIISSINPKSSLNLFIEKVFRNTYTDRINEMEDSLSHFGGYFISNAKLQKYNYDILYFPDYDINKIYELPISNEIDDFFMYLTIPGSRIEPLSENDSIIETLCVDKWENYSKWYNTEVGKRGNDYKELKNKCLNKVKNKLFQIIPELKNSIIYEEGSTPLTNYYYTLSPKGSIYGIKHSLSQMHAPIRARTKLDRFYFTGQSLIFPGIVGVTITSFVTCSEILGIDYLFKKIDQNK